MTKVEIKRVYEPAEKGDGHRVLVDRIWPRGIKKSELKFDDWWKDLAPSTGLRKWFNHDPALWTEFQARYFSELRANKVTISEKLSGIPVVTLLYSAKDERFNQALALKKYIDRNLT